MARRDDAGPDPLSGDARQADSYQAPPRTTTAAACSSASGVSGLIEQSGPSSSARLRISSTARRARAAISGSVSDAISGLAGRPPTTALPVRRWTSASDGLPAPSAQEKAATG